MNQIFIFKKPQDRKSAKMKVSREAMSLKEFLDIRTKLEQKEQQLKNMKKKEKKQTKKLKKAELMVFKTQTKLNKIQNNVVNIEEELRTAQEKFKQFNQQYDFNEFLKLNMKQESMIHSANSFSDYINKTPPTSEQKNENNSQKSFLFPQNPQLQETNNNCSELAKFQSIPIEEIESQESQLQESQPQESQPQGNQSDESQPQQTHPIEDKQVYQLRSS